MSGRLTHADAVYRPVQRRARVEGIVLDVVVVSVGAHLGCLTPESHAIELFQGGYGEGR